MPPLSRSDIKACRHARLPLRFALALVCALILTPLLLFLSVFGVVTLILFWIIFLAWLGAEILFSHYVNNCIQVSELNYPRINSLSAEMKTLLGVRKEFCVFVYEQGLFNAFMMRLFRRRAIFLNSEILEAGVSDDEVRWIIGRFVGYWRTQQDAGVAGWMIRIALRTGLLNLFMLPYERAMVYTGDRLGLACIGGDIGTAVSAMQKLLVGRQLGYSINPVGVVEQRRLTKGSLFGFLSRVGSGFPHTITRYVDLIAFAKRRFPEPFGRFAAANPGLANDLDALSGERTSAGSFAKGIGFLVLYGSALFITIGLWIGLFILIAARAGSSPSASLFTPPATSAPATPDNSSTTNSTPPSAPAQSDTPAPAANQDMTPAAPPAAPPADGAAPSESPAPDGHRITDPVVAQRPSPEDYSRVYPAAARTAGQSGSAVIECSVAADGSLTSCTVVSETPAGMGFGDAAVQLKDVIKLAPEGQGGTPVAGGVVTLKVPFDIPQ